MCIGSEKIATNLKRTVYCEDVEQLVKSGQITAKGLVESGVTADELSEIPLLSSVLEDSQLVTAFYEAYGKSQSGSFMEEVYSKLPSGLTVADMLAANSTKPKLLQKALV